MYIFQQTNSSSDDKCAKQHANKDTAPAQNIACRRCNVQNPWCVTNQKNLTSVYNTSNVGAACLYELLEDEIFSRIEHPASLCAPCKHTAYDKKEILHNTQTSSIPTANPPTARLAGGIAVTRFFLSQSWVYSRCSFLFVPDVANGIRAAAVHNPLILGSRAKAYISGVEN